MNITEYLEEIIVDASCGLHPSIDELPLTEMKELEKLARDEMSSIQRDIKKMEEVANFELMDEYQFEAARFTNISEFVELLQKRKECG